MTDLRISPAELRGQITLPPSKSMAHRAIIAACLSQGQSIINNVQMSDDIIATIAGMESFGAEITKEETDSNYRLTIQGIEVQGPKEDRLIDANESGSTLRFLIPISSLFEGASNFIGRGQLGVRPLDIYQNIYEEQGLRYDASPPPVLDLTVEGRLQADSYEMPGDVSSQFITGLLYTLPLLEGDSSIQITSPLESVGYLDLTLAMLDKFGIQVDWNREEQLLQVPGNQSFQAQNYTVEGDYSQSAFFLGAAALGNPVKSYGLNLDSKQGDKAVLDILDQLGAPVKQVDDYLTVENPQLKGGGTIDGSQCPDIIPMVALVAALSPGYTEIINLHRLRIKECDRLQATRDELTALGADIEIEEDSLHIHGVESLKGGVQVWSHKDHRMAMMLAIASTVCEDDIILTDSECVAKSYPNFWEEFERLGGVINEWRLGE